MSIQPIRLMALGDLFLGGDIQLVSPSKIGTSWAHDKITNLLNKSDLVFCNLEASLTNSEVPYRPNGHKIALRGLPAHAFLLEQMKASIVSLANNHIMDYGIEGLRDTVELLRKSGISYVGAGENEAEARKPVIININGLRVAFLAYTQIDMPGRHEVQYAAIDTPGVARLRINKIREDLSSLMNDSDIRVVSLHWGNAPLHYPRPFHKIVAQQVLKSGADIILGHHAHQLQGLQFMNGKLVAYDLGNFLFPNFYLDKDDVIQYSSSHSHYYWNWTRTQRTAIALEIILSSQGVEKYIIHPIRQHRKKPYVYAPNLPEDWLIKRRFTTWSRPLYSKSYRTLYKRIVELPRGSIPILINAVIEHVRTLGLSSAFKRVLEVVAEWWAVAKQTDQYRA